MATRISTGTARTRYEMMLTQSPTQQGNPQGHTPQTNPMSQTSDFAELRARMSSLQARLDVQHAQSQSAYHAGVDPSAYLETLRLIREENARHLQLVEKMYYQQQGKDPNTSGISQHSLGSSLSSSFDAHTLPPESNSPTHGTQSHLSISDEAPLPTQHAPTWTSSARPVSYATAPVVHQEAQDSNPYNWAPPTDMSASGYRPSKSRHPLPEQSFQSTTPSDQSLGRPQSTDPLASVSPSLAKYLKNLGKKDKRHVRPKSAGPPSFLERDAKPKERLSSKKFEKYMEELREREKEPYQYKFKAKGVPSVIKNSQSLAERQQLEMQERNARKERIKQEVAASVVEFSFEQRDREKAVLRKAQLEKQTKEAETKEKQMLRAQRKAKEASFEKLRPMLAPKLTEEAKRKEEQARKERVAKRAAELLASAKPALGSSESDAAAKKFEEKVKREAEEARKASQFKSNPVPNFTKLQKSFDKSLSRKKTQSKQTIPKEFALRPDTKKDSLERLKAQLEEEDAKKRVVIKPPPVKTQAPPIKLNKSALLRQELREKRLQEAEEASLREKEEKERRKKRSKEVAKVLRQKKENPPEPQPQSSPPKPVSLQTNSSPTISKPVSVPQVAPVEDQVRDTHRRRMESFISDAAARAGL